jgi:hypothetical protein
MDDLDVVISSQYDPLAAPEGYQALESDAAVAKKTVDGHVVITFSKSVRTSTRIHRHFARATVNAEGKMIKLVVSR